MNKEWLKKFSTEHFLWGLRHFKVGTFHRKDWTWSFKSSLRSLSVGCSAFLPTVHVALSPKWWRPFTSLWEVLKVRDFFGVQHCHSCFLQAPQRLPFHCSTRVPQSPKPFLQWRGRALPTLPSQPSKPPCPFMGGFHRMKQRQHTQGPLNTDVLL